MGRGPRIRTFGVPDKGERTQPLHPSAHCSLLGPERPAWGRLTQLCPGGGGDGVSTGNLSTGQGQLGLGQ